MSTTATNRKLVVTTGLLRKFVHIADNRFIRRGTKRSNYTLTGCRDVYWKLFPHFYRRVGKAIARELGSNGALRVNGYDDWADYMDRLTDADIQKAIDGMKRKLNPVAPTPPPTHTQKHGTELHSLDSGGSTGGFNISNPGTTIIPEAAPAGFQKIPDHWTTPTRRSHTVNTDKQNLLQGRLRQALMGVSQCRVTRNQDDGEIDLDRLTDIGTGTNLNGLFVKSNPGKRLSVAVQIYADISSSMDCSEKHHELQLRLCCALGSVLEKMHVPTMIVAYNDLAFLVKGWNRKVLQSMVMKMDLGCGGTNMPHTLSTGFAELAKRRETRKLAVIISDGDIGCDASEPDIQLHNSETGHTWPGKPPMTLTLKKQYPQIETCFFGIGHMEIPDIAFDYKITGLGPTLVEDVSNRVVKVIVGKS